MGRMMRAKVILAVTESARQNDRAQTTIAVSLIFMMELMPRKRPASAVSQAIRVQRSRSISQASGGLQGAVSRSFAQALDITS